MAVPGPSERCNICGSLLRQDGRLDTCTMLRTKRHMAFDAWLGAVLLTVSIRLDSTAAMLLETGYRELMWCWWEALWSVGTAAERAGAWLDLEQKDRPHIYSNPPATSQQATASWSEPSFHKL